MDPRLLFAALAVYAVMSNDKAALSGTGAGYLAFILAL